MSALRVLACAVAIAIGAETGSRVDDYLSNSIDLTATPSYDDLWHPQDGILIGNPHARFKAIQLNNVGLQGEDIAAAPRQGCNRVLFLGSSETFGHPSVKGGAYPDRVSELLRADVCVEVLNASIPGMTARSMLPYWRKLAYIKPDLVFVYPSTLFYLGGNAVQRKKTDQADATGVTTLQRPSPSELVGQSRFVERLRDLFAWPQFVQHWREDNWIENATRAYPASWFFNSVPDEPIGRLRNDLTLLLDDIAASGATPILMSQAISVSRSPSPADNVNLHAMRVIVPRASEQVLAEFPYVANDAFRELAASKSILFLDAARLMSGRPEYFVDMVHFSPSGAELMARLVADVIQTQFDAPGAHG